jgi:hypothetical protein
LCRNGPRFVVLTRLIIPAYARRCTQNPAYVEILRRGTIVVLERSGRG